MTPTPHEEHQMMNLFRNAKSLALAAVDELTFQLTRLQGSLERLADRMDPGQDHDPAGAWLAEAEDYAVAAEVIARADRTPWPPIPVFVTDDGGESWAPVGDWFEVQPVGFEMSEERQGLVWGPEGYLPQKRGAKLAVRIELEALSADQRVRFAQMTGFGA